jgi:hypothetical protein
MTITKAQAKQLVSLLNIATKCLEAAIKSSLVPGTDQTMEDDIEQVKHDRRKLKRVEDWKIRLEAAE